MRIATLAFCLAGLSFVNQAHAGLGFFHKHRAVATTSYASNPVSGTATCATCGASTSGYAGPGSESSVAGQSSAPIRPYSYYAAAPGTARGYYGYGEDQFPYYGRAYGHPYDPWTWPYMTYDYQNSLNRYYEPPVR